MICESHNISALLSVTYFSVLWHFHDFFLGTKGGKGSKGGNGGKGGKGKGQKPKGRSMAREEEYDIAREQYEEELYDIQTGKTRAKEEGRI